MRNLIVCCDGTWNTPDQEKGGVPTPTNVVRLYNAIEDKDTKKNDQVKYYHPGVGSEGNWWEKLAGGGVGLGLTKNIMSAYKWLGENYRAGDRISLFGFSRGAYTARSLAGIVTSVGLLDLTGLPDKEIWKQVKKAETAYRKKTPRPKWAKGCKFHGTGSPRNVDIHLVGVWDTVGALGIPNDLAILDLLDKFTHFEFHNTSIGPRIKNARHAVALDEKRAPFSPTLWTAGANRTSVKQVWFPGVHSDVGGGYVEIGLSNIALKWMFTEATALGIKFHKGMVKQVEPDFQGVLHDSFTGAVKALKSRPRSIPLLAKSSGAVLDKSVLDRIGNPPISQRRYRETFKLPKGKPRDLYVYAVEPWNETGIYLEKGNRYSFTASGQWLDRKIPCGPGGANDGDFHAGELAHMAGAVLGTVEGWWKGLTGNEEADFKLTRREEDIDWFTLVGAIANGRVTATGKTIPHEIIKIGEGRVYRPRQSGYLYCFANDAWGCYDNNKGSVKLTVERLT